MKVSENSCLGQKVFGFNLYKSLVDVDFPEGSFFEPNVESVSTEQSLFDLVFSVNPITGLPDGDLAVYMSENTSPDVKRFIEMNLHQPFDSSSAESEASADFRTMSDDDIAMFTRGVNESHQSYRSRLVDLVKAEYESTRAD